MKNILLTSMLMAGVSFAGFESWANKDGKPAELELVNVMDKDGEQAGQFKMRNGRMVTLKASDLSEESAAKLKAWQPPAAAAEAKPSVFDEILEGNLECLDENGMKLQKCDDATKPTKYYLFYYTASWCPPCQAFTPKLVDFYNKNKSDEFEIILITSDRDQKDMEKYAKDKKMTWPHLKMSKKSAFRKKFPHPGTGIPNLVLCDLEGNTIKTSYVEQDGKMVYQGPGTVMNHLGGLLGK